MKRKIALIGTLTAIAIFSAACGQDGAASDESSSVIASSQSEAIESTQEATANQLQKPIPA